MSNLSFKRFSSSLNAAAKSKAHHHSVIPSSSFPSGYLVTGLHAGVKKNKEALDLALFLSTTEDPASAAACFTKNAFKAAPVTVCDDVLRQNQGRARAIVVNSGCANAVTGRQGLDNAWKMGHETDALLSVKTSGQPETLVMSTGVIGQQLPISYIQQAIQSQAKASQVRSLGSSFDAWERAARAFMTTDTFPKLRARTFTISGVQYRFAGIDKGAGMIHPNMGPPSPSLHATLLGCILTDAAVSPRSLQSALTYAVERSFNSISVDGDMSTNDTILLLANGAAAPRDEEIDEKFNPEDYLVFREELTSFATELAQLVVRDGEGATKFVTVRVKGAPNHDDARAVASKISTSALVKTALFGEDANWGRVLASAGSVTLSKPLNPAAVSVSFVPSDGTPSLPVLLNGEPENVDEDRASQILKNEDFEILVDLGIGSDEAAYYTCDFSYEYVRINGDYRS